MRLFVAVDMSEDVRDKIYSLYDVIKSFRLKPVEKENIHITLKFLGEVPDSRVDVVKERLEEVKAKAFRMHLKGIGFFPSANHIRVVWVGVEEGNEEISQLAEKVENAVKRLGFKRDKSFVAHATIARAKNLSPADRKKLLKELEPYMNSDFGWMDVKDFRLKKSTLTPSGPIYTDLAVYSLEE